MTKISKVTGQCSIDSMKLRIPISDLISYDDCLTNPHYLYNSDSVLVKEIETPQKVFIGDAGLSMQVSKVRHDGKNNVDCLVMTAPSKLLGRQYLDGITNDTFKIIYDLISGSGYANVSLDALLGRGVVTDFDVKKDFYNPSDVDFHQFCKQLEKDTKPSTKLGQGCKVYNNEKQGQGIQWGTRKTATPAYPFFKVYNKVRELQTKSLPFYLDNLAGMDIGGLCRAEVTIKNKQHYNNIYGQADTTLGSILSLSSNELEKSIIHAKRVHLDKVTAYQRKTSEDITGKDLTILRLLGDDIRRGATFYEVEKLVLEGLEKAPKRRQRKLIIELHNYYLSQQEKGLEGSYEGGLIF
jgi:hypothetical protein